MVETPSRDVLARVRKLALLPDEVEKSQWAVSITRLTSLKSLCQQPEVANRFVTYLARKTLERIHQGKGRSKDLAHRQMMADALVEMEAWITKPTEKCRQRLWDLLARIRDEQNEYERIKWGPVRIIHDTDLLLFEYALHGLLDAADEPGYGAYQTARHYAERYNSGQGTGLVASSVPLVQDIVAFWLEEYGLDLAALTAPARPKKTKEDKAPARKEPPRKQKAKFTHRQGQYLAFIHLYRQLHRQGPDESDMKQYFRVTPPAVHGMLAKLEDQGLITRKSSDLRSVRVAIPEKEIPSLEHSKGRAW
jgi:hypothetical protein